MDNCDNVPLKCITASLSHCLKKVSKRPNDYRGVIFLNAEKNVFTKILAVKIEPILDNDGEQYKPINNKYHRLCDANNIKTTEYAKPAYLCVNNLIKGFRQVKIHNICEILHENKK